MKADYHLPHPLPDVVDILRLSRLIHQLCEIGRDTLVWRRHFAKEMEKVIEVELTVTYVMRFSLDPTDIGPKTLLYEERGTAEAWQKYMASGDVTRNPVTPEIMKRFGTDFTVRQDELLPDAEWKRSEFYQNVWLPSEMGDAIYSQVAVNDPSVVDGLGFVRKLGRPDFTPMDVAKVRFVHQELARLWNRPDPAGTHVLPARQRQTLDGIRRGESRKSIAASMGVSESTVHTYEKALFERANVKSRGELLAALSGVIRPNLLP